ncbi:MAG: B-box zinc finger protein [Coriobacteriia bacterium]|nr:B-box zinc finger protein [Coriobacteriia bacterium]
MARCSYHPDVETELSCTECGKPICPKEMVLTPVGYKCPEHAKAAPGQLRYVKPRQLAFAIIAGVVVGVGGAFVVAFFGSGWFPFIVGILWGSLTAEAVRRASGGHRGGTVGAVAAVSIGIGGLVTGMLWATIVAVFVALSQLAVFNR